MDESDRPSRDGERRRGLESVVRLYVSRPIARSPAPASFESSRVQQPIEEDSSRAFGPDRLDPSRTDSEGGGGDREREEAPGAWEMREARPSRAAPERAEDLPPLDPADETPALGEETLPEPRIGHEASRAEVAFRLERELLDSESAAEPVEASRREIVAPERSLHPVGIALDGWSEVEIVFEEDREIEAAPVAAAFAQKIPRIALLLGHTPLRMRRSLLEALGSPVASEGRGVLLLESALPLDEATVLLEMALERGSPVTRRNLGFPPRDILLLAPAERRSLFESLAADERRSDLVVIDLELPESILCPRLQFLVDTIVVALTSEESSLYEAYRALRGIQERRPDVEVFVVPFAGSAEEGRGLFERFKMIAKQFLRVSVRDGGWVELPAASEPPATRRGALPRLCTPLVDTLRTAPSRGPSRKDFLSDSERTFFDHLSDWFGPVVSS